MQFSLCKLLKKLFRYILDAVVVMRAAKIVHTEILQAQYKFKGLLIDEQNENNPLSLIADDS